MKVRDLVKGLVDSRRFYVERREELVLMFEGGGCLLSLRNNRILVWLRDLSKIKSEGRWGKRGKRVL